MAADATKITDSRGLVTGAINIAAAGTSVPTDATTALGSGFGTFYTSADGFTMTVDRTQTNLDAWEATDVIVLTQKKAVNVSFKPLELFGLNADVAKPMFGSNAITTGTTGKIEEITINDDAEPELAMVVETRLKDGGKQRIVIPRFQLTSTDAIVFKRGDATAATINGTCLPDDDGNKAYIYYAS